MTSPSPISSDKALQTLDLSEKPTIAEIEARSKQLLKIWHPDTCRESPDICHQKTREIIEARNLLLELARHVPIDFRHVSTDSEGDPDHFWQHHFGGDPLWSPPGTRKKRQRPPGNGE